MESPCNHPKVIKLNCKGKVTHMFVPGLRQKDIKLLDGAKEYKDIFIALKTYRLENGNKI